MNLFHARVYVVHKEIENLDSLVFYPQAFNFGLTLSSSFDITNFSWHLIPGNDISRFSSKTMTLIQLYKRFSIL